MRRVVEAEDALPEGSEDPGAIVAAGVAEVQSRALAIMRDDPRWKLLVAPVATVFRADGGRRYRVRCVLDTDEGTMANPDEGGNRT